MSTAPLLEVRDIHTAYGLSRVLFGVSLEVAAGECVCLLGRNGVGKTTYTVAPSPGRSSHRDNRSAASDVLAGGLERLRGRFDRDDGTVRGRFDDA